MLQLYIICLNDNMETQTLVFDKPQRAKMITLYRWQGIICEKHFDAQINFKNLSCVWSVIVLCVNTAGAPEDGRALDFA